MMITCQCPHCGFEYELSQTTAGRNIRCRKCEKEFTVVETKDSAADAGTYGVESLFQSDRKLESLLPSDDPGRTVDPQTEGWGRVLELPAPPKEKWQPEDVDTASFARLVEFRRDSRAVQDFVDREAEAGNSILVIAGLILMVGVLLGFLFVVCLLVLRNA
jgi:hypothetical protein